MIMSRISKEHNKYDLRGKNCTKNRKEYYNTITADKGSIGL